VLSAIARDRTRSEYDIAAARYLAIMKMVGYTAVVSALADRLADNGSIVLFGGTGQGPSLPRFTTVSTVNGGSLAWCVPWLCSWHLVG
jgi:hypothetical protein